MLPAVAYSDDCPLLWQVNGLVMIYCLYSMQAVLADTDTTGSRATCNIYGILDPASCETYESSKMAC